MVATPVTKEHREPTEEETTVARKVQKIAYNFLGEPLPDAYYFDKIVEAVAAGYVASPLEYRRDADYIDHYLSLHNDFPKAYPLPDDF